MVAGVALVGEWERSVCAVYSERVEQKIRAKKEGKREKGKDDRCGTAEPPRRTRQACKHAMAVDGSTAARPTRTSTTQRPDRIGSLAPISSFLGFHAFSLLANFYFSTEAYLSRRHSFFCFWPHSVISLLVEDAGVFRRSSIALR